MIPGSAHALMLGGDPCEQYQIGHSVRFNAADTAYLSRTPGVAGNRKTWTWSGWVKRSALGSPQTLFAQGTGVAANGYGFLHFLADNTLQIHTTPDGVTPSLYCTTTMLFRDTAAHYHIVVAVDTTQATATDRVKIYVNGAQVATTFATLPGLNADLEFNRAAAHEIGATYHSALQWFFNGYLSEIRFIDGQSLTPADFGFVCPTTGQWRPKAYAGTYGTNGFHLDFSDGSAATAAALGADRSGNSNNWTPTNLSVTAGAGCDWLGDTPTNVFCTLNPLQSGAYGLSNGNLTATYPTATIASTQKATVVLPDGKWRFEGNLSSFSVGEPANNSMVIGLISDADPTTAISYGWTTDGVSMKHQARYRLAGSIINNTVVDAVAPLSTDVFAIEFDTINGVVTFFKNGAQTAQLAGISTSVKDWVPFVSRDGTNNASTWNMNFGQRAFVSVPSAGFKALCTKNLPKSGTVTVSGSFTGNANADGPFVWMNGAPATLTINGNAVTFGTHADALANGFKVRTSSASYNAAGTNTWTATIVSNYRYIFRHQNAKGN